MSDIASGRNSESCSPDAGAGVVVLDGVGRENIEDVRDIEGVNDVDIDVLERVEAAFCTMN